MTRFAPAALLLALAAWADPLAEPLAESMDPPAAPPLEAPAEPRHARVSPHHGGYDASDPRCAACHVAPPERGVAPPDARLRLDPARACATCHPADAHAGVREHVGAQVAEAVRATLPATIALGEGGAVRCWSCHEVHEGVGAGDLRRSRLAGALASAHGDATLPGAPRARPALLALPLQGGALCTACHGDGP